MFDGDGADTLELQAWKISQNQINYRGSAPCPTCGVILNPVEAMYNLLCPPCKEDRMAARVKRKLA
jgi:predicted RNA-binding Zn-ribbon protein involved in translation (DUF1610 family)